MGLVGLDRERDGVGRRRVAHPISDDDVCDDRRPDGLVSWFKHRNRGSVACSGGHPLRLRDTLPLLRRAGSTRAGPPIYLLSILAITLIREARRRQPIARGQTMAPGSAIDP